MKEFDTIIEQLYRLTQLSPRVTRSAESMSIIFAMLFLRRVDCIIANKRKELSKLYAEKKDVFSEERMECELLAIVAPYKVFNVSGKSLDDLSKYAIGYGDDLRAYVMSSSENVQRVLSALNFDSTISILSSAFCLDRALELICELDLTPSVVSDIEMEQLMSHVLDVFFNKSDRSIGQFSLSESVQELMSKLCVGDILKSNNNYRVYDGTCGFGGLLSKMNRIISALHADAYCYGQDINKTAWAVAQSIDLISGSNNIHVANGNSLLQDAYPNDKFDFVMCDSPYGVQGDFKEVLYNDSRFKFFAPNFDGTILFLQNGLSKLIPEKGRMVALTPGGLFFNRMSGIADFRKYIIENDIVDTIVSLPADILSWTSIPSYIWLFNLNKPSERKGKIQLIDAISQFAEVGRHSRIMNDRNIKTILDAYKSYTNNDISKVICNDALGHYIVEIERDGKTVGTEEIPLNVDSQKYLEDKIIKNLAEGEHVNLAKTRKEYVINFKEFFMQPEKKEDFSELKKNFEDRQNAIGSLANDFMPAILDELNSYEASDKDDVSRSNDVWNTKIKAVANLSTGRSVKSDYLTSDVDAYVLTIGNIVDGKINFKDLKQVTREGLDATSLNLLKPGDIVFSNAGTIGKCTIIPDSDKPFVLSSNLIKISVNKEKCNVNYLFRLISSKKFQKEVERFTVGEVISRINIRDFGAINVELPPIEVQNEIVSIVDKNIEQMEKLRLQLEEQEQTLDRIRNAYLNMKIL